MEISQSTQGLKESEFNEKRLLKELWHQIGSDHLKAPLPPDHGVTNFCQIQYLDIIWGLIN